MKKSKSKRTIDDLMVDDFIIDDFEQKQHYQKKQSVINKDYISLKIKGEDKCRSNQKQVGILVNYSQQNYKQYVKWISQNVKEQPPYRNYSQDMLRFLRLGFNICIYGVGSKKSYLNYLITKQFSDTHVWEVKGYLPSLNDKKIFNHFGFFLIKAKLAKKIQKVSIKELLQQYKNILQNIKTRIVVIFHCLDGQNLLNTDSQQKLSKLFSLPNLQLICSLDNAKIVRHWHPQTKQRLKLLFYNVNTKTPNIQEQYYKQHTNEKKDSSQKALMNIWQSLNKNQKNILKIIVKNQLDNINKQQPTYFTQTELLDKCIQQVILSSQVQLRENLLQLLDHKVISQKTDQKRLKKIIQMKKYQKKLLQKTLDMKIQ